MKDIEIISKIKKITNCKFILKEDKCIFLDFYDNESTYGGVFRHSTKKKEILDLLNNLKNIIYLDLRKNRINSEFNLDLPNLKHLDLGSNYLSKVPFWIKNLSLEYLNLGVNQLSTVPEWFAEKKFTTLKIHKNNLNHMPVLRADNLIFLNLYQNKFEKIPEFVFSLYKLKYFCWGMSCIEEIPEEISNLVNLEWLSLVPNKIRFLPSNFNNLKKLIGIRIGKNKLSEIPNFFDEFSNLKQLSLYKNKIKKIPDSLFNLNNIEYINIQQNPIETKSINKLKKYLVNAKIEY